MLIGGDGPDDLAHLEDPVSVNRGVGGARIVLPTPPLLRSFLLASAERRSGPQPNWRAERGAERATLRGGTGLGGHPSLTALTPSFLGGQGLARCVRKRTKQLRLYISSVILLVVGGHGIQARCGGEKILSTVILPGWLVLAGLLPPPNSPALTSCPWKACGAGPRAP